MFEKNIICVPHKTDMSRVVLWKQNENVSSRDLTKIKTPAKHIFTEFLKKKKNKIHF